MSNLVPERFRQEDAHVINTGSYEPDWRWQRAVDLVEHNLEMSRKRDDDLVALARALVRAQTSTNMMTMERFKDREPHVVTAYEIYEEPDNPMRGMMEACLVTKADEYMIGGYMAVDPIVVSIYENIFYNVRPCYHSEGFILTNVIFPAFRRAMSCLDYDLIMKLVGYLGGFDVLRNFNLIGVMPEYVKKIIDGMIAGLTRRNALVASAIQKPNQYNSTEIIQLWNDLKRTEIMQKAYNPSTDSEQEDIALKSIVTADFKKATREGIVYTDADALEMRAIDMMRSARQKKELTSG